MCAQHAWLAALVEKALATYFAQQDSGGCTLSLGPFQYQPGLSHLSITPHPDLLHTVNLIEFRQQKPEFKGIVGDAEHSIRTTFTREALKEPAITIDGTPFTHIPIGACLKILDCQIRITDCFDPARVDLRVLSFQVATLQRPAENTEHLVRLEAASTVLAKLVEYNLRHSDAMESDSENYEPLASQEALFTQIPFQSLKSPSPQRADTQKLAPLAAHSVSERLSETVGNAHLRPLERITSNTSKANRRRACNADAQTVSANKSASEPAFISSQFITQMPIHSNAISSPDQSTRASTIQLEQRNNASQLFRDASHQALKAQDDPQLSALAKKILGPMCGSSAVCELLHETPSMDTEQLMILKEIVQKNPDSARHLWILKPEFEKALQSPRSPAVDLQGERTRGTEKSMSSTANGMSLWQRRTAAARYVPRYLKMVTREQQELLEDQYAHWQPPIIGQPCIEGQVPLPLFARLSRSADAQEEPPTQILDIGDASQDGDSDVENDESPKTAGDLQVLQCTKPMSPPPASLALSWSQSEYESPERPAEARPRLPPDSSPLRSAVGLLSTKFTAVVDNSQHSSSRQPLLQNQEILSSSFPQRTESDGQDSLFSDPVNNQGAPQIDAIRTDFKAMEANLRTTLSRVRDDVGSMRIKEKDPISNCNSQISSNESATRNITSSLESSRKVQVTRTPAAQKHSSDPVDASAEGQSGYGMENVDRRSLSQKNGSCSIPSSSLSVPRTSFSRPQPATISATVPAPVDRTEAPVLTSPQEPIRTSDELVAEKVIEMVEPEGSWICRKRKNEGPREEVEPKRRKSEHPQAKPIIVVGTDPDLHEWEMKRRQERHDEVEKIRLEERKQTARQVEEARQQERNAETETQTEEKRMTSEEQITTAAATKDDNSSESTGRILSPQSSELSHTHHRVSTPMTRSSDYQLQGIDKEQQRYGASAGSSGNQSAATDTLATFQRQYPSYRGGRKQFTKACQLIPQLTQAYGWDDFVFRYNNDYLQNYKEDAEEAGEQPLPYHQYYREFVDEPFCTGKVITRAFIQSVCDSLSIRDGTPSVSTHPCKPPRLPKRNPISIANSTGNSEQQDPQLPPLPRRSTDEQITQASSLNSKQNLKSINLSQKSSVEQWLERVSGKSKPIKKVPGAESPELGTPVIEKANEAISTIDWQVSVPSPVPVAKSTRRSLPWKGSGNARPSAARAVLGPTSAQTSREEKAKQKAARRHTDFPIHRLEPVVNLTQPVVFEKPRPNAQIRFQQLQTQFAALEKRRDIPSPPVQNVVDIFSWRK